MKKIILSLVLAATAFNGWLAASGSASLSTSELQVDDVEMVAEASENPLAYAVLGGLIVYGVSKAVDHCSSGGTYWAYTYKKGQYGDYDVVDRATCVTGCSIFEDHHCIPGTTYIY